MKYKKLIPATLENFNEKRYLRANPDVAQAVKNGQVKSGFDHFEAYGINEKRSLATAIKFREIICNIFDKQRYLKFFFNILEACIPVEKGTFGFTHSFGSSGFYGNTRAFFEYLLKNNKSKIFFFVLNESDFSALIHANVHVVSLKTFRGLFFLSRCMNICLNHSLCYEFAYTFGDEPLAISLKKRNIINLWHGIPIKKISNILENYDVKIMQEFLCYRGLIASSLNDSYVMCSAFSPMNYKNVWITGLPRNDLLKISEDELSTYYKKQLEFVRKIKKDKKLLLYAPTWRGGNTHGFYSFSEKEKEMLNLFLIEHNAVLGIRLHTFSNTGTEENIIQLINNTTIHDMTFSHIPDIQMIMRECDAVITDYSSLFFDAVYIDKPVFSFAYDYDHYRDFEIGMLYHLGDVFPCKPNHTFSSLLESIHNELLLKTQVSTEHYKYVKRFFYSYTDTNNCERLLKKIEGLKNEFICK